MKKYFIGFLAVVLALGFSAFTAGKKHKTTDAPYFWYSLNGTALGSRLGDVNGVETQYTQGQAMAAGLTPCQDDGNVLCIVGASQSNQTGQSIPSESSNGDNYIEKP